MLAATILNWLPILAIVGLACVVLGFCTHMLVAYIFGKVARRKARAYLEEKHAAAQRTLSRIRQRASQDAERLRRASEGEIEEDRDTLEELERRLQDRAQDLKEKDDVLGDKKEDFLGLKQETFGLERDLRQARRNISQVRGEGRKILLKILDSTEQALRESYLQDLDQEVERELGRWLERQSQVLEEETEARARILVDRVVQRMHVSHAREEQSTSIELPGLDILEKLGLQPGSPLMAAFQEAAQVEVQLDTESRILNFSTMDGVRREVAFRAMSRILDLPRKAGGGKDGDTDPRRGRSRRGRSRARSRKPETWTPETVKALIDRTEKDLKRMLYQRGRKAAQTLKLPGNRKLFDCLGRLNFRTSYGQNILKHSQEVGFLGGLLGAEAGLDVKLAKRCAFLHDIGKSIDYEVEGGHPEIGGKVARDCGEGEVVVNSIEAHHEDVARTSLYPLIVQAADAISGARPGARRRTAEKYLLRMGQIEEIATHQPGVESAYVIQAGREVRVILEADKTSDADASQVAATIARELEKELNFPGKIKVTVIREKRVSAMAS